MDVFTSIARLSCNVRISCRDEWHRRAAWLPISAFDCTPGSKPARPIRRFDSVRRFARFASPFDIQRVEEEYGRVVFR